ncbi:MAG TPA: hypothetical protein DCE42_10655 [Myxococcales bacterium]|nr:hypothetical protein [Myxococcales bacterium]
MVRNMNILEPFLRSCVIQRAFVLVLVLCSCASSAWAKGQTSFYLTSARKAIALGDLGKWETSLREATIAYKKERAQMSFSERNTHLLWIMLFWSKFYQAKSEMPAIKNINQFEDKAALDAYIKKMERKLKLFRRGIDYLRQYNGIYVRIAKKSEVQSQIALQASLGFERDLTNESRDRKVYISFLSYVADNWGDKTARDSWLKQNAKALKAISKLQKKIKQDQRSINNRRRALSTHLRKSELQYRTEMKRYKSRKDVAFWLMLGGGVFIAGGVGLAGVGTFIIVDAESKRTVIPHIERESLINTGMGIIYGAIGAGTLGIASLVIGLVTNPKLSERNKLILRVQDKYIDGERKGAMSSLSSMNSTTIRPLQPSGHVSAHTLYNGTL